jgi:hypothetical protein
MAPNSWLHEIARTYRDIRIIQRALGTDKNPQNGKGCSIALGVVLGLFIVLVGWFILSVKSAGTKTELTPTAVPTEIPTEAPTAVPVRQSLPDPTAPPPTVDPQLMILYQDDDGSCLIKGNINSKGEKIYHVPGSPSYASTKIDEEAGERWFCTERGAIEAGWHAPGK